MSEKEVVLTAIDSAMTLNSEVGASNESLNALVKAVAEEKWRPAFEKFCTEITAAVHGCFSHFSTVMPHLAKVRAHKEFHQARLDVMPKIWRRLTDALGVQGIEPLNLQAVNRRIFDHCMKELFSMIQVPLTIEETTGYNLLADKENALRYASGFVG